LFPCSKRPLCFRLPNHFYLWFFLLCIYVLGSNYLFLISLCLSCTYRGCLVLCQYTLSSSVPIKPKCTRLVQGNHFLVKRGETV
jgi:hypothetical protein